jgi:hypothetical protein
MKHTLLWAIASLLVAGCAITPVHFDGKSATYTHHESDFAAAMLQAKDMCRSDGGKGIKHESTACSRSLKCVTTFVCTNQ